MDLKPVKAKEIPVEQNIFNLGWVLLKMYGNITEQDEVAWNTLVNDANVLYKLGRDKATEKLSRSVALGIIDYLEEKAKEKKQ